MSSIALVGNIGIRSEADLAREARHEIYKSDLINTYRSRLKAKEGSGNT